LFKRCRTRSSIKSKEDEQMFDATHILEQLPLSDEIPEQSIPDVNEEEELLVQRPWLMKLKLN
jgi:hypothetical protein